MPQDSILIATRDSIIKAIEVSNAQGSNDTLNIIGIIVGVISLLIGFYTLYKVRSVAKVQKDERSLTQELLDIDGIESDIRTAIEKLRNTNNEDSSGFAIKLHERIGEIAGTKKVLNKESINIKKAEKILKYGFFDDEHLKSLVETSRHRLNIITGSTRIISNFFILDKIRCLCEKGVNVCIIGIDPDAPDEVLEDAALTVSNPAPTNAKEYRQLIKETIKDIKDNVDKWDKDVKKNFNYLLFAGVPRVSFAQSDSRIDLGFLHFFRDVRSKKLNDRPYIQISPNSNLGKMACKHFMKIKEMNKSIFCD